MNEYLGTYSDYSIWIDENGVEHRIPREKGCACRWNEADERVKTCERHQGWLDVIAEWADRARAAEAELAAIKAGGR